MPKIVKRVNLKEELPYAIKQNDIVTVVTPLEPYHLKNWEFFKDLMWINPDLAVDILVDTIKEQRVELRMKLPALRREFSYWVDICKNTTSVEGFEYCLASGREDFSKEFKRTKFAEFENFLKILDERLDQEILAGAEKHFFQEEF